jgi:O-acetyl-ADP-ribose deacetylase (regulator of RNase III)
MRMRTGVADALRRRGGDVIEEEAMRGGARPLGSCVSTTSGTLCARMVLHAVSAWNEASCVGRAMQHVFLMGDEFGLKSLAIPALGTGVARVSIETCASAMMTALKWHVALGGTRLENVNIVLSDEQKLRTFREVANEALSDEDDAPPFADLGLPVESGEVRVDAATQIDAKSRISSTK